MKLEEAVLETPRELPVDKQQEVLDFAQYLKQKVQPESPQCSHRELCTDSHLHITEEDIAEARKEMWGNFPKEIEP